MRVRLKIDRRYDGLLFLAEAARNLPQMSPHHHRELEANLVVRGSISYVVEGRRFTFGPRTLLWLFPAQEHQLVERSGDAAFFVVVFKPELITRAVAGREYRGLARQRPGEGGVLHTTLEPETFDLVRRIMVDLLVGAPSADVLNRELGFGAGSDFRYQHTDPDGLNAGLRHLMLFGWRCRENGRREAPAVALHPGVRRALETLGASDGRMKLPELASQCGLSTSQFSRLFGKQVGVPLNRYRNSLRLLRFFASYRGGEQKTILEAVLAAGFGSYAQFHRVFTDTYGQSPRRALHPA